MYHEQLEKHNNLNTKMNLHNDDDNVNDGDIHVIIIMLAYNLHAHIMAVLGNTHRHYGSIGQHTQMPTGRSYPGRFN